MEKRSPFLILTLLILCWKALAAGNQTNLKKNKGDDVLLKCELGLNTNRCEWFRDGSLIIPDQKRYIVDMNRNQGICLLKIAGALETDSGYYKCHSAQISDKNPLEHGTALIVQEYGRQQGNNVIHPSQLGKRQRRESKDYIIVGQPQDATANLGDTVDMRCVVNQIPPYVKWMHDSILFEPDGTRIEFINSQLDDDYSIRINSVTLEDNGHYECKVPREGEQSGANSQRAKLTILYAPKVPIITYDGNEIPNGEFIEVTEDATNIVVECTVSDGNPAANIKWFLNGASLDSGNTEVRPSTENRNLRTISSTLNLTREQIIAGNISRANLYCRSYHQAFENKPYEETYAVIAIPGLVTTVNLLQNETEDSMLSVYPGEYVTLYCSADGIPPPEFWWQKFVDDFWVNFTNNGAEMIVTSGQNITFKAEEGRFSCMAKNKYNKYDNGIRSEPFSIQFLDDSGLSVGGIIGVVFGSIAFVAIIIIIVLICYKKRKCCFRSKITRPNPSRANGNSTVNIPQSNAARISSPVLQTGHNSGNNSPQSTSSHGNNKPIYATVLPKNRTRTNRNPSQYSELEEEYIKTLDKHHSELHGTPKSQNSNHIIPARAISMRSSLSSATSNSSSEMSLEATHNRARPISIIGQPTPTTSIHSRYLDLSLPETPIEYHLTKGEKIQYAIVKQQSDV